MPRLRYFVVDAFVLNRPFTGNPAAVVPLDDWPNDPWLQNVAMEMNLSETAFFVPQDSQFHLRWFTPKVEVDLCGHATLATAKIIDHLRLAVDRPQIEFTTRSGRLTARLEESIVWLDFPLKPEQPAAAPPGLIEALGATPRYVGRNQFDYLVEFESEAVVSGLTPDFRRLAAVDCRGVIATARSSHKQIDFVSRFFAPAAGIDEDPVTGSAHCCLADYWHKQLGKARFTAYQASPRGGLVFVELKGNRVLLGGSANIVAQGELLIERPDKS